MSSMRPAWREEKDGNERLAAAFRNEGREKNIGTELCFLLLKIRKLSVLFLELDVDESKFFSLVVERDPTVRVGRRGRRDWLLSPVGAKDERQRSERSARKYM